MGKDDVDITQCPVCKKTNLKRVLVHISKSKTCKSKCSDEAFEELKKISSKISLNKKKEIMKEKRNNVEYKKKENEKMKKTMQEKRNNVEYKKKENEKMNKTMKEKRNNVEYKKKENEKMNKTMKEKRNNVEYK